MHLEFFTIAAYAGNNCYKSLFELSTAAHQRQISSFSLATLAPMKYKTPVGYLNPDPKKLDVAKLLIRQICLA